MWREKDGWQGPYKIAATDDHNVTLDRVNGPTVFRSILIQPYYRDENEAIPAPGTNELPDQERQLIPEVRGPRRRVQPPGSRNKSKVATAFTSKKKENDY